MYRAVHNEMLHVETVEFFFSRFEGQVVTSSPFGQELKQS